MRVENKRIFVSNLPETVTPDNLKNVLNNYGTVTSIEIKERKELGFKNSSLFFAYINVDIDDRHLQQCFKEFGSGKWFGQQVPLQIARESFLDRLRRERSETNGFQNLQCNEDTSYTKTHNNIKNNHTDELNDEQRHNNKSSATSSEHDEELLNIIPSATSISRNIRSISTIDIKEEPVCLNSIEEVSDLVIKNNRWKTIDKNGLKIESVGKGPILTIDKSTAKVVNSSEANLKRLQSLNNLKKAHKTQKILIQKALSKIDSNDSNKKIIFDAVESFQMRNHEQDTSNSHKRKKVLFDEEDEEFQPNFNVKEQFQGQKGQKLLELQSRYKNDKRFKLDGRFLEEDKEDEQSASQVDKDGEEISLEQEKKKEYEILEQVLGKKVLPKSHFQDASTSQKKVMLRFDPSQPDHSKFELKNEAKKEKKKRKLEEPEFDASNEKKRQEKEAPEVSKEIFYKVTDDLQNSLAEKQTFSLLGMFGKVDEKEKVVEESAKDISNTGNVFINDKNPFRYDSSEDEGEPTVSDTEGTQETDKSAEITESRSNRASFWSEPFFFTEDDYRYQEALDFVERISKKVDEDFTKIRRDLKGIVRAKVRNNQRKNKPFKKKLGGNKKKKMLRIKKALKK